VTAPSGIARFDSKIQVNESTGCWLWTGATNDKGYAVIRIDGYLHRAHRVLFDVLVFPPPDTLDHLCRTHHCVNPDHLDPVTRGVNAIRGIGWAGQSTRAEACPSGHRYSPGNTRLSRGRRYCKVCESWSWRKHRIVPERLRDAAAV
jgi:hypothetical protein